MSRGFVVADGIGDALTSQVAGLPGWVWVGAVGGGLALSFWIQRRGEEPGVEPEVGPSAFPPGAPENGRVTRGRAPTPNLPAEDATGIVDNDDWQNQGVEYLTSRGVAPATAHSALEKFLSGDTVDSQEQAIVNQVMRRLGPPPQGAPPIRRGPDDRPKAPPRSDRRTRDRAIQIRRARERQRSAAAQIRNRRAQGIHISNAQAKRILQLAFEGKPYRLPTDSRRRGRLPTVVVAGQSWQYDTSVRRDEAVAVALVAARTNIGVGTTINPADVAKVKRQARRRGFKFGTTFGVADARRLIASG